MHATSMHKDGHTFIEMMMVVGIMGMLAATAVPAWIENLPHQRMRQAAWRVYMDLEQARARAVSENVPVAIQVDNQLDQYSVWVDANANGSADAGETTVTTLQDLAGIDLYAYPPAGTFTPTGTLSTTFHYMSFRIVAPNGSYKYVYVFPNGHIDAHRIHQRL